MRIVSLGDLSLDFVMQVGDARRGDGFDETQPDVFGQRLEERTAAAEQDRHLVQDHLVDQSRLQRFGSDAAAHQGYVLVAGDLAGGLDRILDPGRDEGLAAGHRRRRPVAEDEQRRGRVWTSAVTEAFGIVVRVATRERYADPTGQRVENPGARLAQPESVEHLTGNVAAAQPVEEHAAVAQPAPGARIATGDVAVDRDRVVAEDLAHRRTPSEVP